ncbi:hypothetical protein SK128_019330 [Halocaridina rubra]|uniref:Uncharacterized protein n=1 Tax=Halocaridina rubra TaxID=373956 RepID=A0AAN8WR99_HALRR
MERLVEDKWETELDFRNKMINLVDTDNLRNNLMELTDRPHLAGTKRDEELAKMIKSRFDDAGFDTSDLVPYNVLLSRPNPDSPNLPRYM